MANKTKARRKSGGHMGLALLGCAALALLLYLSGGTKAHTGMQGAASEIAANRAALEALEQREPIDLKEEIKRRQRELLAEKNGILVDDLAAEQQKILAMADTPLDGFNYADFARWFDGTAIVGDSIIRQLRLFEMLDAPVFAEGGIHLSVELSLLDEIEAAKPSVIFLCFGMNDVGVFQDRVSMYAERYSKVIRRLQRNLPEAVIYVHATLPVTEACVREDSDYQYIGAYNEAMKAACPELGAYFIDSAFLLEARPDFYSSDGRHPNRIYYPLWLTYLADITGLSND